MYRFLRGKIAYLFSFFKEVRKGNGYREDSKNEKHCQFPSIRTAKLIINCIEHIQNIETSKLDVFLHNLDVFPHNLNVSMCRHIEYNCQKTPLLGGYIENKQWRPDTILKNWGKICEAARAGLILIIFLCQEKLRHGLEKTI
jgi:hypothetical protein